MNIQQFFKQGMDREIPELLEGPNGTPSIDLGASGIKKYATTALGLPEWNFPRDNIPFNDASVGVIHAYHFLEHLAGDDAIKLLREAERVLVVGGVMNIVTPYYNSLIQAQDITHKSAWNEESWKTLFHNSYYNPAGEWQFRIHTTFIMAIVERNLSLFTQLQKVS